MKRIRNHLPSVCVKVAMAVAFFAVARHVARAAAAMEKVLPAIELKAEPFPLEAVRLLNGPFRDAMLRDKAYLLSLEADRLLHNFRLTAGLPTSAKPLGGWEATNCEL